MNILTKWWTMEIALLFSLIFTLPVRLYILTYCHVVFNVSLWEE